MNAATITETDRVLAEMFSENTGRHMLDSGDAYGRNYDRFQGKTVKDMVDAPEVRVSENGVYLDLFHYLRGRLTYAPELDAEFQAFATAPERERDSWFECAGEFCDEVYSRSDYTPSFNSYNSEDLLTQGFQCEVFTTDGMDEYLLLMIHGGCDIRGGYTRPRVFSVDSEQFGWDAENLMIFTRDREGEDISLELRGGDLTDCKEGSYIGREDPLHKWSFVYGYTPEGDGYPEWDEKEGAWRCPDGDGYLDFEAPYVS